MDLSQLSDEELLKAAGQNATNDLSATSDEELMKAAGINAPNTNGDVLKSLGGGIERGAAAVPFVLPNLLNAVAAGPQLLGRGIAENVDKAIGIQPQPRGALWQPFYGSEDALQTLPEDLQPHNAQTPGGIAADMAGQFIGGALGAKAIPSQSPARLTADDIRSQSANAYKQADLQGGILKSNITDDFVNKATQAMPQSAVGKMVLGETSTSKLIDRLQGLRGKNMSLNEAQEVDQGLGELINNNVDIRTGKLNADGNRLHNIQQSLRDSIDNAVDTDVIGGKAGFDKLSEARQLWSQSAKLRDVENIITRAEMTDNPATTIKTGFRNLSNNKSRMRGFTQEDAQLIKNAAESGVVTDALRTFGSRLIPAISAATGGGFTGTAAAAAGSLASRSGATRLQVGKANKVAESIAGRNPVNNKQPGLNVNSNIPIAAAASGLSMEELMKLSPAEAKKLLQRK